MRRGFFTALFLAVLAFFSMASSSAIAAEAPVLFDNQIAEQQVRSPYSLVQTNIGNFFVTGGFMEPHGHSWKPESLAIFSSAPGQIVRLQPSRRNFGFDYVTSGTSTVRAWWAGTVLGARLDGGYGNRIFVRADQPFEFQGEQYLVTTAYAHLAEMWVGSGDRVEFGQAIGKMGGTGSGGAVRYPRHVDYDAWFVRHGRRIHVSPNVFSAQVFNDVSLAELRDAGDVLPLLEEGDVSPVVRLAQGRLNYHGFSAGPDDGHFGELTDRAVRNFQAQEGLLQDGKIGSTTWRYLIADSLPVGIPNCPDGLNFDVGWGLCLNEKQAVPPSGGFSEAAIAECRELGGGQACDRPGSWNVKFAKRILSQVGA